jgi:hypothetical protein
VTGQRVPMAKMPPRELCPPCGIDRPVYRRSRRFYNHRLGTTQDPCPAAGMTREQYETAEAEGTGMLDPDLLDQLIEGRP